MSKKAPVRRRVTLQTDTTRRRALQLLSDPPPERRAAFMCMACGKSVTLDFDDDEIATLGNIRNYTGPCPSCNLMTLADRLSLGL